MIRLSGLSRRVLIAPVLFLLLAPPVLGVVAIVDNSDPAGFSTYGSWTPATDPAQYGADYVYRNAVYTTPGYYAQWMPDLPVADAYQVSIWYPAAAGRPTNVKYTVYYGGGSEDIIVDQTTNGGFWFVLGTYSFPAGRSANAAVRVWGNPDQVGKPVAADAVRFATVLDLTMVVSPGGGGTTSPPAGSTYSIAEGEVVSITATPSAGYAFSHWEVSAGAKVADEYAATTTVTLDMNKTVTAVFVDGTPVNLTMAVSPDNAGATTPDVPGPYLKARNEVVTITATPSATYDFSHWTVSAGSLPADPHSRNTTVTMDEAKTITAVFARKGTEFRAMWITRFEWPNKDLALCQAYINDVMSKLALNNFNAAVFQMRGQADTLYPSPYEPWSPILSTDGNAPAGWGDFDPMAYAIQKARENGLEFHAYLNAHVCWNSANAPTYSGSPTDRRHLFWEHCNVGDPAHRDWLICDANGTPTGYNGEYVWIAPGIPAFQAYWRKQIMYVVEHYDVDGLHFDRIRTPGPDYSHDPVSMARMEGEANPAGLSFGDWTADQITRTLCDLYAQVMEHQQIVSDGGTPHRMVKLSSSPLGLYTQDRYPGYPSSFLYGRTKCYQDAQAWLAAGAQDFIVPQIYWADRPTRTTPPYFSEVLPDWLAHRANRHVYPGQTMNRHAASDLVHEVLVTRDLAPRYGAPPGNTVFSFGSFNSNNYWPSYSGSGGPYQSPAPTPDMPWRTNPTVGIIIGNVTSDGETPVVDAQITRTGSTYTALSAGDGIYSFLLVPPGTYTLTCTKSGLGTRQFAGITVTAGRVTRVDINYGGDAPSVTGQPLAQDVCPSGTAAFSITATGGLPLSYQWQRNGANLSDDTHYSGVTTETLTISEVGVDDVANYRCAVSNAYGSDVSAPAALTLKTAPTITQQPAAQDVCEGADATFTVAVAGEGSLSYRWQKDGSDLSDDGHYAGATTPALTVSGVGVGDAGEYSCVVTGTPCTTASDPAVLTLKTAPSITEQPDPQSVCAGETATFTIAADGGGAALGYLWQKDGLDLSEGGHYTGTTTATLTVSSIDAGDIGAYRCVVLGDCNTASDSASLVLKAITQQPEPQTVRRGGTATFSIVAVGEATASYRWQKGQADLSDGGHYTGTATDTLTVSSVDDTDVGAYRCVVTFSCGSQTSNEATLTIQTTAQPDFDSDGDVDLADFGRFSACFNGPNRPASSACAVNADLDGDGDVDLADFGAFSRCFNGPNRPPAEGC